MTRPDWAPYGVDLDRPNAARVYDFYLGGAHNFAADRQMAAQALAGWPELPTPMTMRSKAEVGRLLEGYELVEPGLVSMTLWRPDDDETPDRPEDYPGYAAVGFR